MSKEEFKPCPFCGSIEINIGYYQNGETNRKCYVYCDNCQSSTYIGVKFKEDAIKSWNTRTDTTHVNTDSILIDKVLEIVDDITTQDYTKIMASKELKQKIKELRK